MNPIQPNHYHDQDGSGIHCHNAQRAMLGPDGYKAYLAGMVIKYTWRYERKNGLQDLKKAGECLRMLENEIRSHGDPDGNSQVPADNSTFDEQHMAQGEEGDIFGSPLPDMDRSPSSASRISIWGINPSAIAGESGSGSKWWPRITPGAGSGQSGKSYF